jgi:hypothetical protein
MVFAQSDQIEQRQKPWISFRLWLPLLAAWFVSPVAIAMPYDWEDGVGYRRAPLAVPASGEPGFTLMTPDMTGITFTNRLNGAVLRDFDGDGRVDLVVSQNGAATRLFRNRGAEPGLRVRLIGPPGNPNAIGASMRLKSGEWHGPSREAQAGSGYWSQNSAVQVLGSPTAPRVLWVRWPGGKETEVSLPPGAREVAVAPSGTVQVAH